MTSTVRQVIQEAMEQATAVGIGEAPTASEMVSALTSYNFLIQSKEMGDWAQIGDVDLDDNFALAEELKEYFCAMLAVRLCTKFGKAIPGAVAALATTGENKIKGATMRGVEMDLDDGVKRMPSQRRGVWGLLR